MDALLVLAVKYFGLLFDVFQTFVSARARNLTDEEILAEVERIKAKEKEQVEKDWSTVKS